MEKTIKDAVSSRASPQKQSLLTESTVKVLDQLCQTGLHLDHSVSSNTPAVIPQEQVEEAKKALAAALEAQVREQLL